MNDINKSMDAALLHFGKADGNVIDTLTTQNAKAGTVGGFTINGMHISPHNYGEVPARYRIVIDYDSEFPDVLLQIVKVDS